MTLNRREFLGLSAGATAAGLVTTLGLPRHADALALQPSNGSGSPILVVIDLQGGNDALNTFVPDSGIYRDVRPTLALPESDLIEFNRLNFGLHPALEPLRGLWDSNQMTALYGTGLVGQGRSHFVAQDAWRTARPGEPARSGWLGRYLELAAPEEARPLRAIALGQSTLAAEGEQGRPVAIQSVDGFKLVPPRGNTAVTDAVLAMGTPTAAGLLGEVQSSIPATVDAVNELQALISDITVSEDADPDADQSLFRAVQGIIQGDAGTQVIYVTINGFDTHALQAPKHNQLLDLVATGIDELYDALRQSGHADQTLTLVVSEFGRRVAENGSAGTDHGQGGLSFMMGPPVRRSMVLGDPDLTNLVDGDIQITIDARNMYDSALRWLGATDSQVESVLGGTWHNRLLLDAVARR